MKLGKELSTYTLPRKIPDKYRPELPKLHKKVQKHGTPLIALITRGA